jgi:RNA polymerase sigma factor (sigma-70 family)
MSGDMDELVAAHRPALMSYVANHAGRPLLRFDTVEDLVQGAILEALNSADGFEARSEEECRSWLFTVTHRHLIRRREYWFSMKRDSSKVAKLTLTGSRGDATSIPIPYKGSGPVTHYDRRDLVLRVTKAMAMLLPRDRELLRFAAEGASTKELAERLDMTEASAGQARLRAFDRLRKAYRLLEQRQ